jgi:hypothetical protein
MMTANSSVSGTEVFGNPQGDNRMHLYSGGRFDPLHPEVCPFNIKDIAHALSQLCRFGGHTKEFYSVAQHCVLVSRECPAKDAFWGLLHDASEAYLVDIPRPIKYSPGFKEEYRKLEGKLMEAITKHYRIDSRQPQTVTDADQRIGLTEMRDLMNTTPIFPVTNGPIKETVSGWAPKKAEREYLKRFKELT